MKNIVVHSKKNPRLKCNSCGKTWVIHHGEEWYGLHASPQKMSRAKKLLASGITIRHTAEIIGVSASTVQRWKKKFCQTIGTR